MPESLVNSPATRYLEVYDHGRIGVTGASLVICYGEVTKMKYLSIGEKSKKVKIKLDGIISVTEKYRGKLYFICIEKRKSRLMVWYESKIKRDYDFSRIEEAIK